MNVNGYDVLRALQEQLSTHKKLAWNREMAIRRTN